MFEALESDIEKLADILVQQNKKIVVAESCTGGLLSAALTSIAGSSQWFDRGFITYSNESKMEILGVKQETLEQFGAVSEAVAVEMANGALKKSHANVAVAITGIAGPTGGMQDKPVGMVWFAMVNQNAQIKTDCQKFSGDRETIRYLSVKHLLIWMCRIWCN